MSISVPASVDAHVIASDEEALDSAEAFAAQIREAAAQRDAQSLRPYDEVAELRRRGLLALTVPASHGGADVSIHSLVNVVRIISAADPSIGQIPQNHYVHVQNLIDLGTPSQKDFFYAGLLRGDLWGNALSEKGIVNAFRNFRTRLVAQPDGDYRVDGRKFYCTGALLAQWVPVLTLAEDGKAVVAMVRRDDPGLTIEDDWNAMGQKGTASGTVTLENITVGEEHLFHISHYDARPSLRFPFSQLIHVGIDLGIAEEALRDAVAFVTTRSRPWHDAGVEKASQEPLVIHRFGQLTVRLHAARALFNTAANLLDEVRGQVLPEDEVMERALYVYSAKTEASEVAVTIANELFALAGTSATDESLNLSRHWRNARTHTLHDPDRWKFQYIGDYVLNGRLPPRQTLFV